MCQFNNIVLPANTNFEEVKDVFRQNDFAPLEIQNDSLHKQLPEKIFVISTKYQCDCGSVISSAENKNTLISLRDKESAKLKRKGWSETKINNYFKNKAKADSNQVNNIDQDRTRWNNFINELLVTSNVKSIGILAHWYEGDITTEKINIVSKCKINFVDFKPEKLDNFQKDIYYEIQA